MRSPLWAEHQMRKKLDRTGGDNSVFVLVSLASKRTWFVNCEQNCTPSHQVVWLIKPNNNTCMNGGLWQNPPYRDISPCYKVNWLVSVHREAQNTKVLSLFRTALIVSSRLVGNELDYYGVFCYDNREKQTEERQSELISRLSHTFIYPNPKEMMGISIMISNPDKKRNF